MRLVPYANCGMMVNLAPCGKWYLSVTLLLTPPSHLHALQQQKRNVSTPIAYAREGALSKACQTLTDSGLASDTPDALNLLKLKHPEGPIPIPHTVLDEPAVLIC